MTALIGITTYGIKERDLSNPYYQFYYSLPALYVDAVRRAGGIPVMLPPGTTDWAPILAGLNGLIVSGGADIHPERYGGDPDHPCLTPLDPARDESELALVESLTAENGPTLPTLFICRGMQVLNVALGGTLHEHVADTLDTDMHRGEDGYWNDHEIEIVKDSQLHQILGTDRVCTASGHHQAIKTVAADLLPVAQSADGVIEGVAHRTRDWLIGVQWHPEKSAAADPSQQRLFDELVKGARL